MLMTEVKAYLLDVLDDRRSHINGDSNSMSSSISEEESRIRQLDELEQVTLAVDAMSNDLIKEAYVAGYYEGAGDDLWYRDHPGTESELSENASVHRTLNEYMNSDKVA